MADSVVRIGLVLPDVMGTYGDGGNAVVLRQRLLLRGIAAEIVEITLADPVPDSLDLYTLGGRRTTRSGWPPGTYVDIRACNARRAGVLQYWRSARPSRCLGTGTRRRRETGSTAWGCWM
ncbi:cobyric acid synthase CobQ2 [Mycobacterium tuberculosis]|nr:cobyric acid synthase CobQ2 [Mycobacterium tuberculosis]